MPEMLNPAKFTPSEQQATMSQYDKYIHITDPISDIVDLILAFMAVGFIVVVMVKVFRARNGAVGWREGGEMVVVVDLERGGEMVE